jgi:hypothetical protein
MANVSFALNLTITQGDDRPLEFIFWEDEAFTVPLDISAWLLRYTAKAVIADLDTVAKIQLDPSDFSLTTSPGSGAVVNKATALITATDTAAMAVATYFQDLQRTIGTTVTTLGIGQLVIEAQVTQRTS